MHNWIGKSGEQELMPVNVDQVSVEKSTSHHVQLNKVQVDHFPDFINRPYFYQDVAIWN